MPWEIRGYDENNQPIQSPVFQSPGREPFRTRDVLDAAKDIQKLSAQRFPIHLLERETKLSEDREGLPWSDPIQAWGGRLRQSAFRESEYGEIGFVDRSIVWRGRGADDLCSVTHGSTFAIAAVTPEMASLEIRWSPQPFELPDDLPQLQGGPSPVSGKVFFDVRMYSGQYSSFRDDFRRARAATQEAVRRVRLRLQKKSALVVIKVCRRAGTVKTIPEDLSQAKRLNRLTLEFPDHAKRIPDLVHAPSANRLVVFVHGAVSCGLLSVAQLDLGKLLPQHNWFRFEHDTFLPLGANATELAEKIKLMAPSGPVLLVGHSRGGLVARAAAAQIKNREVHVWTFGTPHFGTPLIQAGEGARRIIHFVGTETSINLLMRLGSRMVDGIPLPEDETAALSYLLAGRRLPPGLSELREESGWLEATNIFDPISGRTASSAVLAAQLKPDNPWPDTGGNDAGWYVGSNFLRTYAGEFDEATSKKTGYSVTIGAAEALFKKNEPNDLVVSTASATMGKQYRVLSDTTHFDYFQDATVQSDLRGF